MNIFGKRRGGINIIATGTHVIAAGGGLRIAGRDYYEGDTRGDQKRSLAMQGSMRGSGRLSTTQRSVSPFRRIRLEGIANVVVKPGNWSLVVTFDDNLQEYLTTDVVGDRLTISTNEVFVSSTAPTVAITCPTIEAVSVRGTGAIELHDIDSPALKIRISGCGDVLASGRTGNLDVGVSGTGGIDATALRATISLSGTGDVIVNVSDEARVDLSGTGDVHVLGGPARRSVERSGLGEVTFA